MTTQDHATGIAATATAPAPAPATPATAPTPATSTPAPDRFDPTSLTRFVTIHYYKTQFTGWSRSSYVLLAVGIAVQLAIGLSAGVTGLALTSTLAGIIGFTCTVAITNGKPINGLLGFISAALFGYVALVTGNYSDIVMQVAYIAMLDLPIIFGMWRTFEPKTMKRRDYATTALLFVGFFAALFAMDTLLLHSPQAFLDAFSATIGLVGAVLCVRQFRAQYYFWTFQGIMSVALWIQTAINGHAVWVLMFTYVLYLANDLIAFVDSKWFKNKDAAPLG